MREEAHKRIGHLYPEAQLSDGTSATVVAWLWARTVPCINPACSFHMPLISTFQLSRKKGNEHWIMPIIDQKSKMISWIVQRNNEGVPKPTVSRTDANCCGCGTAVKLAYVREQGKAGKMEEVMTAIIVDGKPKMFVSPTDTHIQTSLSTQPIWKPTGKLPMQALGFSIQNYGFLEWNQLFTDRQLVALSTFGDLLGEVRGLIMQDGAESEYASTICTYLAFAIDRAAESNSSFAIWDTSGNSIMPVFGMQKISMMWDFAEANPFSTSTQNWMAQVEWIAKVIENLPFPANKGKVYQANAATTIHATDGPIFVTDPPYYKNIGYADLSDFFLRLAKAFTSRFLSRNIWGYGYSEG